VLRALVGLIAASFATTGCHQPYCGNSSFVCFSSVAECEKVGIQSECCTVCAYGNPPTVDDAGPRAEAGNLLGDGAIVDAPPDDGSPDAPKAPDAPNEAASDARTE
jgi:hypothetical protein